MKVSNHFHLESVQLIILYTGLLPRKVKKGMGFDTQHVQVCSLLHGLPKLLAAFPSSSFCRCFLSLLEEIDSVIAAENHGVPKPAFPGISMPLPFTVLSNGKQIRTTKINNILYMSGIDLVMGLTGKNSKQASDYLNHLGDDVQDELSEYRCKFQFDGDRQQMIDVYNMEGVLVLLGFLGGKVPRDLRFQIRQLVLRYFAGDQTLHSEINNNAASSNTVNEMAREYLSGTKRVRNDDMVVQRLDELQVALMDKQSTSMAHIQEMMQALTVGKEREIETLKALHAKELAEQRCLLTTKTVTVKEIFVEMYPRFKWDDEDCFEVVRLASEEWRAQAAFGSLDAELLRRTVKKYVTEKFT